MKRKQKRLELARARRLKRKARYTKLNQSSTISDDVFEEKSNFKTNLWVPKEIKHKTPPNPLTPEFNTALWKPPIDA